MKIRLAIDFLWTVFAASATVIWLTQALVTWRHDDELLRNTAIIKELVERSSDRWTGEDQQRWAEECLRLNPNVKFPDAEYWPRKVRP